MDFGGQQMDFGGQKMDFGGQKMDFGGQQMHVFGQNIFFLWLPKVLGRFVGVKQRDLRSF